MKSPILALFLALSASGATITVCTSGCDYPTAQAALNASDNGDTIILTAGQTLGSLTIPGDRHDLTVKSSAIDGYPRNYRITRNNPALARLTSVTIGDFAEWGSTSPGSPTLTSPVPHGFNVGDTVTVGGTYYSAYACASVNQPPYVDGACDASRVGFMNIRADTHLGNGSVLYFKGRTLPTPLLTSTPYYVVNFTRGGAANNADKFQLATTPGGGPLFIPQFNPEGQDLVVEVPPLPQRIGDTMYVVATPSATTLQLSAIPGGTPTVWTQIPYGNTGGGLSTGFSITRTSPDYNLTFDGIEIAPAADDGVYYPFYVSRDISGFAGEPHNITIWRCWVHGADDQEDFPNTMVDIAGHDIEIGWSVIENAYSTSNDTQNIGFMSTANVSIHDNELKGATEGILSGGNLPWFAFETNTTGVSVYRNYLWKPLKAYTGIVPVYVSPTQFQLLSRYQDADCSTVATHPDLGYRCFAYEAQETPGTSTPPSAAVVSRTEWGASAAASTFTVNGLAGQKGYVYLLGGVFHMDHNFTGAVSCPSGIACTFVAAPSFPIASTRIGIEVVGSDGTGHNYFDSGTFYQENRNVWSKNLLESKYGDNWLIEGNVFHRQSNCDNGSTCQDPAIQFTLAVNGSGSSEPVNYMVSSSNSTIRNNIFRMLSAGVVAVGKTYAINTGATGLNWEFSGFGQTANNTLQNNLFMDLGSSEYQAIFDGAVFREQDTQAFTVQHNTALDVRIGFLANPGMSQNVSSVFRSNVVVPYRSTCTTGYYCASPAATSEIGVQDNPGPPPIAYFGGQGALTWSSALSNGLVDATSAFDNNLLMNRPGVYEYSNRPADYPLTTWLVQAGDAGRDPNTLFSSWQERDNTHPPNGLLYRAGNYRLASGQTALYPAYDSRTIGADIDEIEALTGQAGIDVENGWPTFAQRVERTISAGSTSAVLSYLPNGSTCTIGIWPNSSYSGAPAVMTTDGAVEVLTGIIPLTISGLSPNTAYYGKRWCGAEVDVFSFTTQGSASTVGNGNPVSQNIVFPALSNVTFGATPFALSASSTSGLPVAFASTTLPVCTVSGTTVTIAGAGTCSITASQAGNTNYAAATPVVQSFTVNPASQTITFNTLGNVALGAPPFTISASASSGLTVTFASTTLPVCTVSGTTVTILTAGTCSITASQPGNANYTAAPPVVQNFGVGQTSQTITFNALGNVAFGVPAFPISAGATSGLAVTFASTTLPVCTVSGTTVTIVAVGTCSITASQAGNATYSAATPVVQSFTVTQATQTITFNAIGNVAFGAAPFAISATASSGLTVTFASTTPTVCTVSGTAVTIVALGACSLTASQPGNANYSAAPPVTQTFTVTQAAQTIAFGSLGNVAFGASPFAVSATDSSGLPVSFASNTTPVCTVSGAIVAIVAIGTCSITASQPGNANYSAAAPVTQTLTVTQATQTISFGSLNNVAFGTAPFAISATASSGLVVGFVSNTAPVCTLNGTMVTIVAIGTCSITASQPGNANYSAAPTVTQTFNAATVTQSITFPPLGSLAFGTAPFALSATASSGLPVSFASTTGSVCTVSGNTLTIVAAGTCSITATQPGNANVPSANPVIQSFTVVPAPQFISFGVPGNVSLGVAPFALSATSSSGLTVGFASNTPAVCTVSGVTVTTVAIGTCSIMASQPGNANYLVALPVTQSFSIASSGQNITFAPLANASYGAAPFLLIATASSGLPVSFASTTGAVCTVSGAILTIVGAGTCTVVASQAGNTNYQAAAVSNSFVVSAASQAIAFPAIANQLLGAAPSTVSAAASSGLPVSFSSLSASVCTVSGVTVTLVSAGTCTIQAMQSGNANYLAAASATQSFTVSSATAKPSEAGIFRQNFQWLLDANGNRQFDGAGAGLDYVYNNFIAPQPGDKPVVGDWSGSGTTKIGIFRPSTGQWFLDYNGNGVFDAADKTYNFGGIAGDIPVVGDWSGSGTTKIGIFRSGYFWLLDYNGDGVFDTGDQAFPYGGEPGDVPIAGDWNGDGKAKVGIVRPFVTGGTPAFWILDANDDHTVDAGDLVFAFGGLTGDLAVAGDWNGSGTAKAGVFRQGFLWVVDQNGSAPTVLGSSQLESFGFGGIAGDVPVVGKW